jgi:ATP-dependent protease HslVU (ClpYQ) peptidase subunit
MIIFGADSAGSAEYAIMTTRSRKIFKKRNLLFGVAGSWRHMQIIHHTFSPPEHPAACSDEAYITVHVLDALKQTLQERGVHDLSECSILLGYRQQLYRVNHDYGVLISHSYDAIGSGDDVAKGALFATQHLPPVDRVTIALHAATEHTAFVRPPYVIEMLASTDEPQEAQAVFSERPMNYPSVMAMHRSDGGKVKERLQQGELYGATQYTAAQLHRRSHH